MEWKMTMRRKIPVLLMAASGVAMAQTPEGAMPAEPAPAPEAAPAGEAPSAPPGEVGPDGKYTIKTGDTLWDLSQKFLNNPWYWPKIWADNPGVENPHWIYPGNALRIRNGADGMPAEVAQDGTEVIDDTGDENLPVKPTPIGDLTAGTIGRTDDLGAGNDLVTQSGRLVFKAQPMRVMVSSIVTDRELASSGMIVSSFEQKELLSNYDRVYLKFDDPKSARVGTQFTLFRPGAHIVHPVTKASYGYQTLILGTVKILGRDGDLAVGELGNVSEYVSRGDRVGQATNLERNIKPVANAKELDGIIVATEIANQTWAGESHVVFVDKGAKDGVQEGNTFDVVQSGDGLTQLRLEGATQTAGMPGEAVAQLLVFDVRDETSAAMIVKSVRELGVGDKVEMRPAIPGAGGF